LWHFLPQIKFEIYTHKTANVNKVKKYLTNQISTRNFKIYFKKHKINSGRKLIQIIMIMDMCKTDTNLNRKINDGFF